MKICGANWNPWTGPSIVFTSSRLFIRSNQMGKGKGRFRPAHNPRGLPVRRAHTGPKSKKLILDSDSDVDGDAEITSDEEK